MASYLKFELEDGTTVYIEAFETQKNSGGLIPALRSENATEQTGQSFEKSFDGVSKLATAMMWNLREGSANELEEVSVTFGVKASSEINKLVVSRGGVDSNFSVTMRWRNQKKDEKEIEKTE
jgi:hypothetical protein